MKFLFTILLTSLIFPSKIMDYTLNEIKSVFELGAGSGEYLDVFKLIGSETYGIEGSLKLATKARNAGHSVYDGFLPETDLTRKIGNKTFDLVTSFNFIEHLPDPLSSLRVLVKTLKPGGNAILEVPNFDISCS